MALALYRHFSGYKGKSGFNSSSTAEQVTEGLDLSKKVILVTGAASGIGLETARVLSLRGAHVILAVRNAEAGEKTREKILEGQPGAKLDVLVVDLSSLASVRAAAADFLARSLPLHIFIANAGVMACPFAVSTDGHELQFATNHLGHFLLTSLLLDHIKATAAKSGEEGRIVVVASWAHEQAYKEGIRFDTLDSEQGYTPFGAYGQSKLANILFAKELAQKLKAQGVNDVTVNALHPGCIMTNLGRHMKGPVSDVVMKLSAPLWKSVPQGAATQCYVATSPLLKGVTGEYFSDNNEAECNKMAMDPEMAKKLWEVSEQLVK